MALFVTQSRAYAWLQLNYPSCALQVYSACYDTAKGSSYRFQNWQLNLVCSCEQGSLIVYLLVQSDYRIVYYVTAVESALVGFKAE